MNNISLNSSDSVSPSTSNYYGEIAANIHIVKRIIAFIGLFLNILIMTVILRNYRKLNNPMYLFIFNVAIPDVAELVAISADIFSIRAVRTFPTVLYIMFHIQMTWYLTLFSVLGLSLNRTVAVLFWRHYDTVRKLKLGLE